ncbi:hypothetical protein [Kitasatospora sp. NPDC057223]|uniref:hypothetical protein n=1 Tax=Kitasatospora sp. NPDC057223 TaxID=3346055 RepID=UPI00362757F1
MAICVSCGAASAEGARGCASCGRPLAPPPPLPPTARPALGPPPTAPPAVGSWGSGTVLEPGAARPAVLRRLTAADWRPALRAVVAPTGLLLLAALLAALPSSYGGAFAAPFGSRFGASLAASLAALGAPFRLPLLQPMGDQPALTVDHLLRVVPMTVTILWLLALWLGLRSAQRRRQARTGEQLTGRRALDEAVRTGLVAAAVTLLLGTVCGARWLPPLGEDGFTDSSGGLFSGSGFAPEAGWPEAVGWTFLLAGLVALAVYGTDALRWAAWRSPGVRGWAVAGLTAGRVLAALVGVASLAALAVVSAQDAEGMTWASLAFLPNLGLLLVAFGSGATVEARDQQDGAPAYLGGQTSRGTQASFFDLEDFAADWRWAGLLAVAAALLLGWTAFRRRLDTADRIRLAVVYAGGLSLLALLAGARLTTSTPDLDGWGVSLSGGAATSRSSVGVAFATVLAVNVIWAAVGALGVPPLLAAVLGRGPAAGAAPAGPGAPAPRQAVDDEGLAAPAGYVPSAVVPAPTDLLDSHGRPGQGPAAPGGPGAQHAGEDSSVWRRQDPPDA